MRMIWHIARHDLRLQLAEKANIFFLFLMPMGFVFLFSLIGGGGSQNGQVALPVVDLDEDFLSNAFIEHLRTEGFVVNVYDAATADTTEFGSRVVTIPDSFTVRVLRGEQTEIRLDKRSDSSVSFDFAADVRLHLAQVRFLGDLVRWAGVGDSTVAGPGGLDDLGELSASEKGRFTALALQSSFVTVNSRYAGQGRPVPSGTQQSVPGVLVMFVVMTVLIGGSEALTREKQQGTLRRLATSPLSSRQVLLGKTLGLTLLGFSQVLILVVSVELMSRFGVMGMDFFWSKHLLGVLPVFIAYCACVASLGLLVSGLLRTPQQAESLAWLFGLIMSALGGAWWPAEAMPSFMKVVVIFLPTGWAMEGLHRVITFGQGPASVFVPVMALLAMTAVFWALGSRLMKVTD